MYKEPSFATGTTVEIGWPSEEPRSILRAVLVFPRVARKSSAGVSVRGPSGPTCRMPPHSGAKPSTGCSFPRATFRRPTTDEPSRGESSPGTARGSSSGPCAWPCEMAGRQGLLGLERGRFRLPCGIRRGSRLRGGGAGRADLGFGSMPWRARSVEADELSADPVESLGAASDRFGTPGDPEARQGDRVLRAHRPPRRRRDP